MKYEPDLAELVSFSDKKALNKAYNFLFKSVRLIINKILPRLFQNCSNKVYYKITYSFTKIQIVIENVNRIAF